MGDIVVSEERWPIAVFTFPPAFSDEDLADVCADCDRLLQRRELFFGLRDLRGVTTMPSAKQRRAFAEWQDSRRELFSRFVVGLANVSESALLRGAMTAIHWVTPPPAPEIMVPTMAEALRWGAERFRIRSGSVPSAITEFA